LGRFLKEVFETLAKGPEEIGALLRFFGFVSAIDWIKDHPVFSFGAVAALVFVGVAAAGKSE
jgi:hypothetical protein